eukprot:64168_1
MQKFKKKLGALHIVAPKKEPEEPVQPQQSVQPQVVYVQQPVQPQVVYVQQPVQPNVVYVQQPPQQIQQVVYVQQQPQPQVQEQSPENDKHRPGFCEDVAEYLVEDVEWICGGETSGTRALKNKGKKMDNKIQNVNKAKHKVEDGIKYTADKVWGVVLPKSKQKKQNK